MNICHALFHSVGWSAVHDFASANKVKSRDRLGRERHRYTLPLHVRKDRPRTSLKLATRVSKVDSQRSFA